MRGYRHNASSGALALFSILVGALLALVSMYADASEQEIGNVVRESGPANKPAISMREMRVRHVVAQQTDARVARTLKAGPI